MKRTNIHLRDEQRDWLKNQSAKTGLTAAELTRWALDEFIAACDSGTLAGKAKVRFGKDRRYKAV